MAVRNGVTLASHIKILLISVVIASSSVFWTHETVYNNTQLRDVEVGFPIGFVSVNYLGEDNINNIVFKLPADFGLYGNRDDYYHRDINWVKLLINVTIFYGVLLMIVKFLFRWWDVEQQIRVVSLGIFSIFIIYIVTFFK